MRQKDGVNCVPEDIACLIGCFADDGNTDEVERLIGTLDDDKLKLNMVLGVCNFTLFHLIKIVIEFLSTYIVYILNRKTLTIIFYVQQY